MLFSGVNSKSLPRGWIKICAPEIFYYEVVYGTNRVKETQETPLVGVLLRKAWGDKVTIWGGMPSMLFGQQYSDQEFDDYVINLFKEVSPGHSFIVGMGDNLPFDARIERVGRLVDLIEKYGHIPVGV